MGHDTEQCRLSAHSDQQLKLSDVTEDDWTDLDVAVHVLLDVNRHADALSWPTAHRCRRRLIRLWLGDEVLRLARQVNPAGPVGPSWAGHGKGRSSSCCPSSRDSPSSSSTSLSRSSECRHLTLDRSLFELHNVSEGFLYLFWQKYGHHVPGSLLGLLTLSLVKVSTTSRNTLLSQTETKMLTSRHVSKRIYLDVKNTNISIRDSKISALCVVLLLLLWKLRSWF